MPPVTFSTVTPSQVEAWQKELDDPATTPERRQEIVTGWTASRVADTVNRGTECLSWESEKGAWNTEQENIRSCYQETMAKLDSIRKGMGEIPGADARAVDQTVAYAKGIFEKNAETAYRKTLYLGDAYDHESFLEAVGDDAERDSEVHEDFFPEAKAVLGLGSAVACVGGVCAPPLPETAGLAVSALKAGGAVAAGAAIVLCALKVGNFLSMKAQIPEEMTTLPEWPRRFESRPGSPV